MFRIGCDVEHGIFQDNNLVSAIGRIPGTKHNPFPLPNGGGLQVDNVLLEWNSPVASTEDEFVEAVLGTQKEIKYLYPQYTLGYKSSYLYPPEELNNEEAWIIGCEPDFNAYEWRFNTKDNCINYKPSYNGIIHRTAAGHIHVSELNDPVLSSKFLRLLDLYLGIPSLFLDDDRFRRNYYGKAGSFRTKEYSKGIYGVEYRTIGAFWVEREDYIRWVYKTCKNIYDNLTDFDEPDDCIEGIINNYDINTASNYMSKYNLWP